MKELLTELDNASGYHVKEVHRNDDWDVIEIVIDDHDTRTASECITSAAHRHEFKVCGWDEEEVTIHRKK